MIETDVIVVIQHAPNHFEEFVFTISGDDFWSIVNQANLILAQMPAHAWRLKPREHS